MWVHSYTFLLCKSAFECAHTRFFFKPKSLTSGILSVPWDTKIYSTSFERSTNFLQYKILKEWIEALLKWFMLCQSSLILLHKMGFQPFCLHLTVWFLKLCLTFNKISWKNSSTEIDVMLEQWILNRCIASK